MKKSPKIYKKVALHPESVKQIKKGHPWIIKDRFTEQFPKDTPFLVGSLKEGSEEFLLLNDFSHPKIKARLWSSAGNWGQVTQDFPHELSTRISQSLKLRIDDKVHLRRNHFYWCFSEADFLPGLMIIQLGKGLLVQITSSFWILKKTTLLKSIKKVMLEFSSLGIQWVAFQDRQNPKNSKITQWFGPVPNQIEVKEGSFKSLVKLDQHHDVGVYTDMAGIREQLEQEIKNSKKALNLFCYTGSFSLWLASLGVHNITSIDLSKEYLDWFEYNLSINSLNKAKFKTICSSVHQAIVELEKKSQTYDTIIYDPPTLASDGGKTLHAFKHYEQDLETLIKLLAPNGKLIVFNNTHSISKAKFEAQITKLILPFKNIQTGKSLSLCMDCPTKKGFPEGSYLKGKILIKKEKV